MLDIFCGNLYTLFKIVENILLSSNSLKFSAQRTEKTKVLSVSNFGLSIVTFCSFPIFYEFISSFLQMGIRLVSNSLNALLTLTYIYIQVEDSPLRIDIEP